MSKPLGEYDLSPGVNVDAMDIAAGMRTAIEIGYTSGNERMLAEYCLNRHAKGEEDLAQRTAVDMGIDLTSWYRILASALASEHSRTAKHRTGQEKWPATISPHDD